MSHKTSSQLVGEATARVEDLSVQAAADELSDDLVLLVDIRESEERHQYGTIPGSMSVPRGLLEFWAELRHRRTLRIGGRCAAGDGPLARCTH